MVGAVLFDVDDTLVDFSGASARGIRHYLAEIAPGLSEDEVDCAVDEWVRLERRHYPEFVAGHLTFEGQRRARVAAFREAIGAFGDPDPDLWMSQFLAHSEAAFRLFPDVDPVIDALRAARIAVAALSNSKHEYQEHKLAMLGLLDRVSSLTCCDDAGGASKPDPEIFRVACRELALPPGAVAYVGDRLDEDARGANAAGLQGVWLDRVGLPCAPVDVFCVRNLFELASVLEIGGVRVIGV